MVISYMYMYTCIWNELCIWTLTITDTNNGNCQLMWPPPLLFLIFFYRSTIKITLFSNPYCPILMGNSRGLPKSTIVEPEIQVTSNSTKNLQRSNSKALAFRPGAGQNVALHASPTARISDHATISSVLVQSDRWTFPPPSPPFKHYNATGASHALLLLGRL